MQSPSLKANLSRQERERFGLIVLERIDDVLNFESSWEPANARNPDVVPEVDRYQPLF